MSANPNRGHTSHFSNGADTGVHVHDPSTWDALVVRLGGQIHQSWTWGAFKAQEGWVVERIMVTSDDGTAIAQVLFKRHGPVSTGFIPRGPLVDRQSEVLMTALWDAILDAARRFRAVDVLVESQYVLNPLQLEGRALLAVPSRRYSPVRTVVVALKGDDELLAGMHRSKRREIRKAIRRDIVVEDCAPDETSLNAFHKLMADTSVRNKIRIEPKEHYGQFLRLFGDDGVLKLAVVDGKVAAGLIAGMVGREASYLFGGSSTEHRVSGATALLQFSAMQWARDRGCTRYDLWGIPEKDPESFMGPDNKPVRSIGSDDSGLYRFKVEFGGDIVSFPPSFEVRTMPRLWWAANYLKVARNALQS